MGDEKRKRKKTSRKSKSKGKEEGRDAIVKEEKASTTNEENECNEDTDNITLTKVTEQGKTIELNNDLISKEEKESNNEGEDEEGYEEESHSKRKRKRKRKKKQNTNDSGTNHNDKEAEKLTSNDHTVYVEGIPFDCREEHVRGFFVENGCDDVIQLRLPQWQDSGRLRGYGHIVFNTTESRDKAISELDGKNLGRRYLSIKAPNAPKPGTSAGATLGNKARAQPDGCKKIFVKNLPYDATESDIHDVFMSCGKIIEGGVRLARNYSNHQCKGFGYVEFKNPEGAYAAVNRAAKPFGVVISGRPCFVDYDEQNMKGSFRTDSGKCWQKQHGSVHGGK